MSHQPLRRAFISSLPLLSLTGLAACGSSTTLKPETTSLPELTVAPSTSLDPSLLCGVKSSVGTKEPMWWSTKSFGDVTVTAFIDDAGNVCGATAQWDVVAGLSKIINEDAVPQLNKAVADAKGANIHGVSGATATDRAYIKSLQAALDASN